MTKEQILAEIRRMESASGGKAPGQELFESETGISRYVWYPRYWQRWSDAILEAGGRPNAMSAKFPKDHLVEKYVALIREIHQFPREGDLILKHDQDKTFPCKDTFRSLGTKSQRAAAIIEYCQLNSPEDLEEIISLCTAVRDRPSRETGDFPADSPAVGYVYLLIDPRIANAATQRRSGSSVC